LVDAAVLRREFDASFAAPARAAAEATEDLLALRVAGDKYVVRLAEVTGLFADRVLAPLPSAVPEFLGVISLRGVVIPAWSLGALLGYGSDRDAMRWAILVGHRGEEQRFALLFARFEGHLRVPRVDLASRAPEGDRAPRAHVRHSVRVSDTWCGVLALDTIAGEIERRLGLGAGNEAVKTP
jgi:chemotaxis signal transduction protein